MRGKQQFIKADLQPADAEELKKWLTSKPGVVYAVALALAAVDVLAYASDGHEGYVTLGLKRDRTAFLLTQTFGTEKVYFAAESVQALLEQVKNSYQDDV